MSHDKEFHEYSFKKSLEKNYDNDNNQSNVNNLYSSDNFISKPIKSKNCTIDKNIIQLHHSFGYDCFTKIFNICAADNSTVVYAAGSYIVMYDINKNSLSFRKCAGNGGIGHITKNPRVNHLAVGENCSSPLIIVYEWPTFEVISVLKGGAEKQINWLTYNQDGNYLCSQGGQPDNTLTVWDWRKSKIILRTKSYVQDVYICRFSNFTLDHLVTAGLGHIQFWKMANTFTGLKFKGRLGRFGKTEVSNVIGIFSMPDEKVISGCERGNILVWDEDRINVRVTRKGGKPCHSAPVIMFLYAERDTELTSVSADGTIKCWHYRTVDAAHVSENGRTLEMEPSFTVKIQDSIGVAKIMGMCKCDDDPSSHDYFVQDGNGGIWLADIEVSANAKPLRRLAKFHGDVITSLQASPIGYFIATASLDGWLHVYDVVRRRLIFMHDFRVPVTSSMWLPFEVASSGSMFVVGFKTGILKVVAVSFTENVEKKQINLIEVQSSKPHASGITQLTMSSNANILVCGSDDCSIFIYKIETEPFTMNPIGMYPLPGKVTFIYWKPSENQTALISCASGHIIEVIIPTRRPSYTKNSFLLKLETRIVKTINENLKDSDKDEESSKCCASAKSNPVLFAIYTPSEKTLWVSIDGDGAGYLYEYDFNSNEPINVTIIPDKKNISLTAINVFGHNSLSNLMGFADGKIRVTNVKVDNVNDLSDYIEYSVHDNKRGKVKMLCFSQDNRMLFTCGDDGNIFSYTFQCEISTVEKFLVSVSELLQPPKLIEDGVIKLKEDLKLTLEEKKVNKKKQKSLNIANREKDKIYCSLYELKEKFKQVLISNNSLPDALRFPHDYFLFDERINNSLVEEAQSELDKLKLKLAFDYEKSALGHKKVKNYFADKIITNNFEVRAVLKNIGVQTIYHEAHHNLLSSLFKEFVSKKRPKLQQEDLKDRINIRLRKSTVREKSTDGQSHKTTELEMFLRNMREIYPSLPKKIQNAIDKFASRIDFENKEVSRIKCMYNEKPDESNVEEEAIIEKAWETIGNFNLKMASDFKPSDDQVITMEDKFEQYTRVKEEINNLKSNFNEKVFDLKKWKDKLIDEYKQFKLDIYTIQNELNDPEILNPSDFSQVLLDESINSDLIDSFEPIYQIDYMYLILNPEKSSLYMKMPKNELHDEPTYLEITMLQMRKENLKHRHKCLHESMLAKINTFDDHLLTLVTLQKDIFLSIIFLELFALTLEEELIVLNNFELHEDEYSHNVYLKTSEQNDKVNQILTIRENIKYNNKIIQNNLSRLMDVQHTFNMEIRNNDFAKYLKKIFKKKKKLPQIKCDCNDESLSSSSSNRSDNSDPESLKNGSEESLIPMGRIAMFDENILPEGCDPKLFDLTLELRSQRHEIEQSIENSKRKLEFFDKNLSLAYAELNTIENELKQTLDALEAFQIKKLSKLNEIETTVILNKSQMIKAKLLESSILIHGNVLQVLTNRVAELKKEKQDIKNKYKEEISVAKQLRKEINVMEHILKKYKTTIKDEMIKKFRMETDWNFMNDMDMAIINYMIIQAQSNSEETKECFIKEVKLLENQIRAHQEILTDLLEAHTVKTITLKAIRKSILQLQQSLSIQQKNSKTVQDLSIDNDFTSDIAKLKNVYDKLLKQKQAICKEIDVLKYKGKMFPPITKHPPPKMTQGHSINDQSLITPTAQEESEESWVTTNEEESYNIEFNMEPKIVSASSKQSLRLTKQSLHCDSFENVMEGYEETEWKNYYDCKVISPCDDVDDYAKGIFNKIDEMQNNLSDDNESIGSNKNLSDIGLNHGFSTWGARPPREA